MSVKYAFVLTFLLYLSEHRRAACVSGVALRLKRQDGFSFLFMTVLWIKLAAVLAGMTCYSSHSYE